MKITSKPASAGARYVEIDERHAGQRLDNFLITRLKGVPRSRIYRIVRRGEVRLNGGRAQPDRRLKAGDIVRLPPLRMAPPPVQRARVRELAWLKERVLYEDDQLLALDKPAGMVVHAGSGVRLGLIEALRQLHPEIAALDLVHRLDRDTSGVLLFVKDRAALTVLHSQLRSGTAAKRYLALVRGRWRGGARRVVAALEKGRLRSGERMVSVADEGKQARTRFIPKQKFAAATLVEIELLTGRTHQARVHAAHIGHPVAGDDKYGDRTFNREMRALGLKRLFLHAKSLGFRHPRTDSRIVIEAPLPPDLTAVLARLTHEAKV